MECSVYNAALTRVGTLNPFSLVWAESFRGAGALQLVANKTDAAIKLLQNGYFAGIPASDTLMYIQSVEDRDGQLWAYGCESKYLLYDRVYAGTVTCGTIETSLRGVFTDSRPYGIMALGALNNLTATADSQKTYEDLFTISQDWCALGGYGFRTRHDKASRKLLYEVYAGVERTNVKFSSEYGNLSDVARKLSTTDYKNVAYVGGEEIEGAARVYVVAGDTASAGLDRREMYVDGGSVKQGTLTGAEYEALLVEKGLEEINRHNAADEITFGIRSDDFGTKYNLGDTVTCRLAEYGLVLSVQITAFQRTYESNKDELCLTLGTPVIRRK